MPQHEFSRIEGMICLAGGDSPKKLPTRESLAICALSEHGAYTVKLLNFSAERIAPQWRHEGGKEGARAPGAAFRGRDFPF